MLPELIPTRTSEHKLGIYTLHTKALQIVPSLKGSLDQLLSHKALQQMRGYMITTGEQKELYSVCSIHAVVTVKHTGQQAISIFFYYFNFCLACFKACSKPALRGNCTLLSRLSASKGTVTYR